MRLTNLILTLLALTVFVGGCKEQKKESPTKVTFNIDWVPGVDYIGYYIADAKGFYKDENIDVTILPGNGASQAAQLIGSHKIEVGTTTGDVIVRAQHEKIPVIAVAVIFPRNPVVILSLASNPITNLKQLEGKRLGYHMTSVTYDQFKAAANKQNINLDAIQKVEVGWGGAAELMKGDIDAVLAYTTDKPVDVEARGVQYYELPLETVGMKVIGQCIAVHQETVNNDTPKWLKGFVKASIRGWEYARNNPIEAAAIFSKRFTDQDEKKCQIGLRKTIELLPDKTFGEEGYSSGLNELWQQTENNIANIAGFEPRKDATILLFKPIKTE